MIQAGGLGLLLLAFFVAWASTGAVVRWRHLHDHISADHDVYGVQKFHTQPVPRVGGIGIAVALVLVLSVAAMKMEANAEADRLLWAALPAFAAGLAEDITKRVGVLSRLVATMVSAGLGVWLLGASLNRLGIPGVDSILLAAAPLAWLLTLVAVAGVANAVNIIDGFNGLSSGASAMMFAAFAVVAWQLGDALVLQVCLATVGALLGFMVWNWPGGRIFLGDGGAYLVGFLLAEVAVLLVVRNPQLSPWFCLLVCLYPVTETAFSIYRRHVLKGTHPGMPDAQHLHTLIHRRWVRGGRGHENLTARNSATSPYLWVLTAASVLPAVLLWSSPTSLVVACLAFIALYVGVYRMIVRFHTPRWLVRRVKSASCQNEIR